MFLFCSERYLNFLCSPIALTDSIILCRDTTCTVECLNVLIKFVLMKKKSVNGIVKDVLIDSGSVSNLINI